MSNTTLPIYAKRSEIVSAVETNPVVIITAETGAGKSTQVPQYLLEEGYELVVTQPRRLAARTVAARVAEEFNTPLGEIVGFRTAHERQCSKKTRCLFATDGLALLRELLGIGRNTILVVDEVHEWNTNIEVLVAWAKRQIEENPDFKLVLMSATLEAERLSDYFDGAPIISVPGRTFPVKEQPSTAFRLEEDVVKLLQQGRNVLVFQPGKQEIANTIELLKDVPGLNAEILPLHGELSPSEQARCFQVYGRPKCVVSTNVAQTSVTIPDIDAVVDSGVERRIELVDGIEGLYLRSVSLADSVQRMGRAGRTKPGVYIDRCPDPDNERYEFPVPEILRVRLDQAVLRLAEAGIDMEALRFFHQPDVTEIRDAKRALIALGCMDRNGSVTQVGHRVAKMPVSVKYGRMVVEAERLGVVSDIITVAAILEQGGIIARVCQMHQKSGHKTCDCWRQLAPSEVKSDVLAQLEVYKACEGMSNQDLRGNGVFTKAYRQAKEKRRLLAAALKGKVQEQSADDDGSNLLRAICAGMVDHLYHQEYGKLSNGTGQQRELARESIITRSEWLVGEPFDLEIKTRDGCITLSLVRMATAVKLTWLVEVAPQLVTTKTGISPYYDESQDQVVSTTQIWFNGQGIEGYEVFDPNHPEAVRLRRDGRNRAQWQRWTTRPTLIMPNPASETAIIPDIRVCAYGIDPESGESLLAYGTIKPNPYRHYRADGPWFEPYWTRVANEAESAREKAVSFMEDIRAQARAEQERAKFTATALSLREEINELLCEHESEFDDGLYDELMELNSNIYLPNSMTGLEEWISHAEAVIADARAYLSKPATASNEGVSDDSLMALAARFNKQ